MSGTAALRCSALVVAYGDFVAVDGLDLEVRQGECFGLLGPNGAGKTTAVETFEGLRRPQSGTVELFGQRWGKADGAALRRRLGVALQETRLAELLTVRETVRLFRSFYPAGRAVDEVIGLLGLTEKRDARVGRLSGGQRQRLSLACALVGAPDLLFLDEPTTGLDPQARLRIWEIIHDFRAVGGTVLLTTHAMDEAARLCDRVAIIDRGKLRALDTPRALVGMLGAEQVIEIDLAPALAPEVFASLEHVRRVERRGESLLLFSDDIPAALPGLLRAVERAESRVVALHTHQATLEDVFVHLTGRGLRDG